MCFFFFLEKPLKNFQLYSPILLTLCLKCLSTRIKESYMYFSCQHFFKTPKKNSKIPTKIAATANKKNISKHGRREVFSTDIH